MGIGESGMGSGRTGGERRDAGERHVPLGEVHREALAREALALSLSRASLPRIWRLLPIACGAWRPHAPHGQHASGTRIEAHPIWPVLDYPHQARGPVHERSGTRIEAGASRVPMVEATGACRGAWG
jgi:hypothetical protein